MPDRSSLLFSAHFLVLIFKKNGRGISPGHLFEYEPFSYPSLRFKPSMLTTL